MDKLSKLTKSVLVDKKLNKAANAALICHETEKILRCLFGKDFLKEVGVISFREGCLYLSTTSSAYSQEIVLREKDIVDAVNKILPNRPINKIRFKVQTKDY